MKTIIRWIADMIGVTKEIRKETFSEIGNSLMQSSYYYGSENRAMAGNALFIYGMHLRKEYHISDGKNRDVLDELGGDTIHNEKVLKCQSWMSYYKNTLK